MKMLIVVLLAASVSANAWLMLRPATDESKQAPAFAPASAATVGSSRREAASEAAQQRMRLLAAIDPKELGALRDALRAAGVDDSSIRGVLEGVLSRQAYERSSATALERWQQGWWSQRLGGPAGGGVSLRQAVHEPLRELMGPDPLDLADAEVRYDFLPPEKRRMLALIDLDYGELQNRSTQARANAPLRAEIEEQQLLARERRKDILAALTPEEQAEYDLRFAGSAAQSARRFAALQVTEQEYRAIKPIIDGFAAQRRETHRDPTSPAFGELQQRTVDQLVAAIGYERTIEYLWTDDGGPFAAAAGVLREANLPARQAARLLQLAAETGVRAEAVHADASLTAEGKRDALRALQQSMQSQVDALLPAAVQAKLPEEAIGWLALLGEGRYKRYVPILEGGGWIVPPVISLASPPVGPKWSVPLPRRVAP